MTRRYLILTFLTITIVSWGQENSIEIVMKNQISTQKVYASNTLVAIRQFNVEGETVYAYNNDFLAPGLLTTHTHIFQNKLEVKSISTHSSFPGDTTVITYRYDSLKHLEHRTYKSKGLSFTNYEYDSLGQLIKETELDSTYEIRFVRVFKYNSSGQEIEKITQGKDHDDKRPSYFSKNSISRTYYDALGRQIKFTTHDREKLIFERLYSYDDKSRVIDEFDTKELRGAKFIYNEKGQLQARYRYKDLFNKKNIIGREVFKYYRNGLIKSFSEDIFNGRSEMRTLIYKYE